MMSDEQYKILYKFCVAQRQVLIDALVGMMDTGLNRKEAAEAININPRRAYSLLRYGSEKLTGATKEAVRRRDKYRCKKCGKVPKKKNGLHVHHKGNPRDHSKKNLVSLCGSCHQRLKK